MPYYTFTGTKKKKLKIQLPAKADEKPQQDENHGIIGEIIGVLSTQPTFTGQSSLPDLVTMDVKITKYTLK